MASNAQAKVLLLDTHPTFFATPADFSAWLADNHASEDHLWVGYYKKATGEPSITWENSVREALCFGWIDGVRKTVDDEAYMIRFTPRKPGSVWSQKNIDMVEELRIEGRMTPAGLKAYANRDVHPDSGYRVSEFSAELPDDLTRRFKASPDAWQFYQAQPAGYRRLAATWVLSAKREETRERRFTTLVDDSASGLRVKQFRRKERS